MELDQKASTSEEETLTDHYVILETLGKGAFAEVKLAYHLHTEEQVAIKVLKTGTENDFSVKTEMDILKTLNHPNITQLFHLINTKEYTYMVMEHVAGGDLVSHVERVGRLQEEKAQHIFVQLACAVDYCHKNGIAHRDIKLDNILLDGKGNIKLCDFGLATRVTPGQGTKGFCGTLEYCAPELFCDSEYDARAVDIWSMGVVLYTMVTASFPFKANTYSEMKEEMLDPQYHLPYTLSDDIGDIIVQLLTVDPEQRPKISDIRQHEWLKTEEEFSKITTSIEALCNNLNPSIVLAMWNMGYDPKAVSSSLREKNFNHIMATYLILNKKSHSDHSQYAVKFLKACVTMCPSSALANFYSLRGLSELALPTLQVEHQVHVETGSGKKWMKTLSMPANFIFQLKGNKHPPRATKFAQKFTAIKGRRLTVDSMACNCSSSRSLSSESISSPKTSSSKASQDVNISDSSSYTQSPPSVSSYSEVPHSVNPKATYDIQRSSLWVTSTQSTDDVPPEGIPEVQKSSLQATSKDSFDAVPSEGIAEIQKSFLQATSENSFDVVPSEGIPEIHKSFLQVTSENSSDAISLEGMQEIHKSSLQATSENSFDAVPPEGIPEIQKSFLQATSENSSDAVSPEGIQEIHKASLQATSESSINDLPPEGIPEIPRSILETTLKTSCENVPRVDLTDVQTSSLQETCNSSFADYPVGKPEIQRSSLQNTSKNSLEDVLPEVITATSASHLSRVWKRIKKRIRSCLRLLGCCCMPASKRSHVSQNEGELVEVESGAVTHKQLHGVPKMHSCVT